MKVLERAKWYRDGCPGIDDLKGYVADPNGLLGDVARDLEAALALVSQQAEQIKELQKQNAILSLSVPLEEDLSNRIDEMLKYLAMQDGFTLAGIARLLSDVQRRMADDWQAIGSERRDRQAAEARAERAEAALLTCPQETKKEQKEQEEDHARR